MGVQAIIEDADGNPYLERFYQEPPRWALQNFLWFFEQSLRDEMNAREEGVPALQERVIEEHVRVFGELYREYGFLDDSEYELVARLGENAGRLLPPSDLLLHLEIVPAEALARIHARARPQELAVELAYLENLNRHYERFLESWSESPVIRLRAAEHDFRRPEFLHPLRALIEERFSASMTF